MAVRVGSSTPDKFYVGGSEVSRLYQGSNLVWEPSGAPPTSLLVDAASCSEHDGLTIYPPQDVGNVAAGNWAGYGPASGDGTPNLDGSNSPLVLPVGANQFRILYAKPDAIIPNTRAEVFAGDHNDGGPKLGEVYPTATTPDWSTFAWTDPATLTTPVPAGYDSFWVSFGADTGADMFNLRGLELLTGSVAYDGYWFDSEGGVPGNPVTTSDAFIDPFTLIEGTVTYTASGYTGTGFTIPAESDTHRVTWDKGAGAASSTHSVGFWFYPDAIPTASTRLSRLAASGTVSGLVVSQNGTGFMEMLTGTTPEGGLGIQIPSAGAWYWVTYWVDLSGDQAELALYDAAGSLIESVFKDGPGFPDTVAYACQLGRLANTGNFGAARFDDFRWIDTSAALIPPVMA